MITAARILTRALITALVLGSPVPAQRSRLAGTYLVSVCKQRPCEAGDTTNAVVTGTIVMVDSPLDLSSWGRHTVTGGTMPRAPNGCLDLVSHRVAELTYIGIGSPGLFNWEPETDTSFQATLYRSPDASAVVDFALHADRLTGTSVSSGYINGPVRKPADIVIGKRLGPPDLTACRAAVLRDNSIQASDPLPSRFETAVPLPIDPTRRYVFTFADDPDPSDGRRFSAFAGAMKSFGLQLAPPGTTVILATALGQPPDTIASLASLHIAALVHAGVPSTHITVVGVGGGTRIAALIAGQSRFPLSYAFIGDCPASNPAPPIAPARVLAIADSDLVLHDTECGRFFRNATRQVIPARSLPIGRRWADWGDWLVAWMLSLPGAPGGFPPPLLHEHELVPRRQ